MDHTLEKILARVQKPGRYVGGEYNAVQKDKSAVDCRFAFCFPDTYEIGMSNLGMRILYGVMNEMDGVWCERVFAPWGDMEAEMRREGLPLYALESGDPVSQFDIIGFSLGYEMAYTNVLNMLDLAGVPLRSKDRPGLTPLVIAGGTSMYNPEPLAPFVDIVSLGEGEDVTVEMIQLYRKAKQEGWTKAQFLQQAAQIPGLYVPSLYAVSYTPDGRVAAVTPQEGAPAQVTKRIVTDMDRAYYPVKTIVPSTEITQDRVMLELFRGCIRGCRFCQAGFVYRPVRRRSQELLTRQGIEACQDSGYQDMTLMSLSSSDYPDLLPLCDGLLEWCEPHKVNLALPSLRADNFSMQLMEKLQRGGRKSGLTFAPEAGSQRLRDAINKNVTEEELLNKSITYNGHDPETSFLEAVLSRGDRRIADVIEEAWRHGAKFDSWSEYFSLQTWMDAFAACGVDPTFYANRLRDREEVFPWTVISDGVTEKFLWREREQAYAGKITPDCREKCSGCGANRLCEGGICHA